MILSIIINAHVNNLSLFKETLNIIFNALDFENKEKVITLLEMMNIPKKEYKLLWP